MNNKIKFMLPGVYEKFHINQAVVELFKEKPDYFIENFAIGACYGNFQFCLWDGGRSFPTYNPCRYEKIEFIKNYLNSNNIPVRLIYTNPKLEKKHIYNRFSNLVTQICENNMNEIVCNSQVLEDYLRETYPQYSFISSTTKCLNKSSTEQELTKNYKYVCLDYNLNKNKTFLESMSIEEKEKTEFLINAICPPGCPNRKHHYDLNGLEHINFGKSYSVPFCEIRDNTISIAAEQSRNNISIQEIQQYYVPLGFFNFKIEGRTLPDMEVICNYAKFFIKPEHQLDFINSCYESATLYQYPVF